MAIHVRGHKVMRDGKMITVKAHTRVGDKKNFKPHEIVAINNGHYDRTASSFINGVNEDAEGGLTVIIKGRSYPYPYAGKEEFKGLVAARSTGSFYNKFIKGRYF